VGKAETARSKALFHYFPAVQALELFLALDGALQFGEAAGYFGVLGQEIFPGGTSLFELSCLGPEPLALGLEASGVGLARALPSSKSFVEVRNPAENGHRFRRKADSVPELSGQGSG